MEELQDYLGDGLYAKCQAGMIMLRAERSDGWHWVGLEPNVYAALLRFAKRCAEAGQFPEVK